MPKINMTKFIWMDGKITPWHKAKIHILTHSLHYGSAVFEGIHSYKTEEETAIFRLDEHIDRLFNSANALGMKINFTKNQLKDAIKKLIKINKLSDAYIRPLVYYGYGNISVYPKDVPSNAAIIALPRYERKPKSLRVMTSKYTRYSEKSTVFGAKISGNYVNSILAMQDARKKGYDEALMLDEQGFVSEGPIENIFLVKNGNLITPSSRSALHGITRDSILKISNGIGIKAYEKKVTLNEVKNADELFYCGTAKEISPIISVDNKIINNGKIGTITLKIKNKFFDIVKGRDKKYKKWLTYVDKKEIKNL